MSGAAEVAVVGDYASFRKAARALAARGVPPSAVTFREADDGQELLFGLGGAAPVAEAADPRPLRVPRKFADLAEIVAHHRDRARWALLYRLLHRLVHDNGRLLEDAADEDVRAAFAMRRQVQKDAERMKAFVRFRRVGEGAEERFVAWHRPDHRIVPLVAPFFADRFGPMRWSILTPDESVHWDGEAYHFGPGVPWAERGEPGDAEMESLWRTYYGAVFDPARVHLRKMRADMPARFHAAMPELTRVPELVREAAARTCAMIEKQGPAVPTATDFLPEARTLPVLREAAAVCRGCDLYQAATQTVFGEGPRDARVMLVGEQPGDEEDVSGRPFVGPAGRLLDEVLAEVGIDRRLVYVTNAVKHFKFEPRGKRRIHKKPAMPEIRACSAWLRAEVEAIGPRMIVCLGASAAQSFMGPGFRLLAHRGEVFTDTGWAPWWMATYHPSALLRMPDEAARAEARRAFTEDLRRVAEGMAAATSSAWP